MTKRLPNGYWTLERLKELAATCETRNEFRKKHNSAYMIARRDGHTEEIFAHMTVVVGNRRKRAIYAIEFKDNSVYIGLTCNYNERFNSHVVDSSNKHVKSKIEGNFYFCWVEFNEWFVPDAVLEEENRILESYVSRGFKVLNINKTGSGASLGGRDLKWTKPMVMEVAAACDTRTEFIETYSGAYQAAVRNDYLDECCKHMKVLRKPNGYWTKRRITVVASLYTSRSDFMKNEPSAYKVARKTNYLETCCAHMVETRKPNGFWHVKKNVMEVAKLYSKRGEFENGNGGAYNSARKNGWLDELFPKK